MKRFRLLMHPRFSIRSLLILTAICGLLAWDISRQRNYDQAIAEFESVFPGGNVVLYEPTGIRKIQSQCLTFVGLKVLNRQIERMELYPEDPSLVTKLSHRQAQLLRKLPAAESVQVSSFDFSLAEVSLPIRQNSESWLGLSGCRLRNSALVDLRMPFLGGLFLSSCQEIEGLDSIDLAFPNLRQLSIDFCPPVENIPKSIRACKQLTELTVCGPSITDDALSGLGSLKGLTYLSVYESPISDAPLSELSQLRGLFFLQLRETFVTDSTLNQLGRLPNLERLILSNCERISDEGISHLRDHLKLRELRIDGNPGVTDKSANAICSLSNLGELWIKGTQIGPYKVEEIARLPHLHTLLSDHISGPQFMP